jgi:hypothetical protein
VCSVLVIGFKPVKFLGITIRIPWIWYVDYGVTVGSFDYESIMIYGNSGIQKKSGGAVTRPGFITATDAATVKKMY